MENAPHPIMDNAPPPPPESEIFKIFRQIAPITQASIWTFSPSIIVYIFCCVCFLTLGKRLHYRRNLTDNFKNYTFWRLFFLKFSAKMRL